MLRSLVPHTSGPLSRRVSTLAHRVDSAASLDRVVSHRALYRALAPLLSALLLASLPAAASAATILDKAIPERKIERLKLNLGGFVQPRLILQQEDTDAGADGTFGFQVRRVRLEFTGELHTPLPKGPMPFVIGHKISVEFAPEPQLQDGWFEVGVGRAFRIRAGQQKTPSNRSLLNSDKNTLFPERGHNDSLAPRRDMGVQVRGALGRNHLEYGVGVFNGEGRNRVNNVNRKFLYVARLAVSPLGSPGTGYEMLRDGFACAKNPEKQAFTFTLGYAWHFNQIGPPGTETATMGHNIEFFTHYRWVTAQAELLYMVTDFEEQTLVDFNTYGWYVQVGLFPPMVPWVQDHLAVLFRVEEYDEFMQNQKQGLEPVTLAGPTDPNQKQRNYSFGLSFYAGSPLFLGIGDLRVQAIYTVRTENEGQPYRNDEFVLAAHLTI